jgi:hypothetical protein
MPTPNRHRPHAGRLAAKPGSDERIHDLDQFEAPVVLDVLYKLL